MDYPRIARRTFLGAAAVASLAPVTSFLHAEDKKKADEFGGFILGVQSYSFRNFKLEPALKKIQDLGLHYVEFYNGHVPVSSTPEQIRAVLKLCKDYDITPVAYGVEPFSKNHDENKKRFELGKALGIKTLSADPTPDSFDDLDKLVEEYKISIGIHPHGPQGRALHRWYSAEKILEAVKDHHPLIGTCIDTAHIIRVAQIGPKLDPVQQIRLMGDRNFGLHLKDHDNAKKTDVIFGKGALDVPGVLQALRDLHFKGYISIEYEAHPEEPSSDMRACVEVFKESVKKLA